VVSVHAGQVPHAVPHCELYHADYALSILFTAIKGASGEMLNQADPLGDFDLLLLRQLTGRTRHVWGRIKYLHIRRRLLKLLYTVTVV